MNNTITNIVVTGTSTLSAAGIGVAAIQELVRSGGDALTPIPFDVLGAEGYRW